MQTTSPSLDQGMNLAFEQKLKPNQIQVTINPCTTGPHSQG